MTAADRSGKSEHVEIGDVVSCSHLHVHIPCVPNMASDFTSDYNLQIQNIYQFSQWPTKPDIFVSGKC